MPPADSKRLPREGRLVAEVAGQLLPKRRRTLVVQLSLGHCENSYLFRLQHVHVFIVFIVFMCYFHIIFISPYLFSYVLFSYLQTYIHYIFIFSDFHTHYLYNCIYKSYLSTVFSYLHTYLLSFSYLHTYFVFILFDCYDLLLKDSHPGIWGC